MGKKLTTEDFIKRARIVHGDKYDYSKVDYKGSNEDVIIICPIHGEFKQTVCEENNIKLFYFTHYEDSSAIRDVNNLIKHIKNDG